MIKLRKSRYGFIKKWDELTESEKVDRASTFGWFAGILTGGGVGLFLGVILGLVWSGKK